MQLPDKKLNKTIFEEIRELEESLWRAETRFNYALMDVTFAPDFFEFGRSGKKYSRTEMLFDDQDFCEINATLPLPEFQARFISEDVIQVSYVSEVVYEGVVQRGNRSSIWSRMNDTWRLRFHQGTPIEG